MHLEPRHIYLVAGLAIAALGAAIIKFTIYMEHRAERRTRGAAEHHGRVAI